MAPLVTWNKFLAGRGALVLLALILAAGCALRLRQFSRGAEVTGYYSLALNLKSEGVLAYPGSPRTPTAFRAPLYPAFLYPFAGDSAAGLRRAFLAQLALAALAALLVWAAAGALTGSPAAALAAAALYALHPANVLYTASFQVEFFFGALIAAAGLAAALAAAGGGTGAWAAAFLLAGAAAACKSPMALFPAVLAGWILLGRRAAPAVNKALPLLLLLACLPLAPWALRNARHFGEFAPLERNAARGVIYTAGRGLAKALMPAEAAALYAADTGRDLYSREVTTVSLLRGLAARPADYLRGLAGRLGMAAGAFPLLLALAAAGAWLYRASPAAPPLVLLAAYFLAVHLAFSFEEHYLVPLLPVLAVLAGAPAGRLPWFRAGETRFFGARAVLGAAAALILAVWLLSAWLLAAEAGRPGLLPQGRDAVETLAPVLAGEGPAARAAWHNQRGVLRAFAGDFKAAAAEFAESAAADPAYPDASLNLAHARLNLGDRAAALAAALAAESSCAAAGPGRCPASSLAAAREYQRLSRAEQK